MHQVITLPPKVKDMHGKRYGRLTAIAFLGMNHRHHAMWKCECDCGTTMIAYGYALRHNHTKSCGCLSREFAKAMGDANIRHGHCRRVERHSPEHKTWSGMIQRCCNPNHTEYHSYGGRGITICAEWVDSFETFLRDMGNRPAGCSLDRIDVDGGYNKSNCRWATQKEQCRNMRTNRMLTFNGESRCVAEWVEVTGIKRDAIVRRLAKGWSVEQTLTTPVRNRKTQAKRP